ncbi:MAG: SDR family NAD(P)-dependent oxidoreductase [Gammaproteobacteria bacterium]|nr:MAG: SDR family NAD(P)-dependent oxidoreductase [Gammaproteobacteria bacterium]
MGKFNYTGQTVVITGAAGALGSTVAELFFRAGADIALVDISFAKLTHPRWKHAKNVGLFETDLTDVNSVNNTVAQIIERFGKIDCLANVAGGFKMGPMVHETSVADWDFMINLNAKSVFLMCRAVIPHMLEKKKGKIVNVAARAAVEGKAKMAPYCVSKAAVVTLTQSLAAEHKMNNINVNCILPGTVDTQQNRNDMPDADFSNWVPTTDLANEILHLCSEQAKGVTGAAVPVYGKS